MTQPAIEYVPVKEITDELTSGKVSKRVIL